MKASDTQKRDDKETLGERLGYVSLQRFDAGPWMCPWCAAQVADVSMHESWHIQTRTRLSQLT